ncbi:hypothetical protein BAE44_0014624 [Dichanthelium oligosanthes]|uniref:Bifunctional lysine-specific demethylase and histidyl-hydroxylase n=1 Tax=Dichanthelium oligosanthes TaxID=888268 RepID=A0A1E5VGV4_9POAL|nr:hypothetical protein BAE44_0014624 [Dichanthelium oligosanthes]
MHSNTTNRNEKRKKRKERGDEAAADDASPSSASFDRHVFPILLAAAQTTRQYSNSCSPATLAARLLRRVLSRSPQVLSPLPDSLVALLPRLLSSSCSSVAALSCEVLGAAALRSMEAGEVLASDSGIASGLARALGSRSQRVTEAACNSIMDLSASSVGRERLAGSPILPRILYVFSQVESICELVDSRTTKYTNRDAEANKISYLIIDTVVLLVNSCKVDKLQSIQQELVRSALCLLYNKVWKKVLLRSSADCNNGKDQLQSREYEISKAIFRLSIDLASPACLEADVVWKSIFGQTESNFQNFVLAYWEKSPNLYRRKQSTQNDDPVFSALHSTFNLGAAPDAIIESFIKGLVSCPAIASDELDINSFLQEVHYSLGDAVKYRQDIRVLRTQEPSEQISRGYATEEHFFDDGTVFLDEDAFTKNCKHAFKNGYSIALRGMEFRSEKVAAIASALADLFGQPSVGANIYFSPARSQGLARHYDDHCVLVWQLLGCKKWMVWPNPKLLLPRLYEPFDPLDGNLDDNGGRVEVLHEGDTMYIPRGYVHEAHTDVGDPQMNAHPGYSLHLTLAIEVEPPFEWEGFAHIALHCWVEKQKLGFSLFDKSQAKEEISLFSLVLHVAIRLLSNNDPIFRKACLVAAKLPSSSSCATAHLKALRSSQRSTFDEIIRNIEMNCSFKEALRSIELAVQERNDEPFQWMSWLRHLPQEGDADLRIDFSNILEALEELVEAFSSNPEQALVGFTGFKSRFCRCVVYEDACESFETLLRMYRTTRNQYMRGMMALHGAHVTGVVENPS